MRQLIVLLGVVGMSLSAVFVRLSDAPSLFLTLWRMAFSTIPWGHLFSWKHLVT